MRSLSRLFACAVALTLTATTAWAEIVCGREITTFEKAATELAADEALVTLSTGGPNFLAYRETKDGVLRQWFLTKPGSQGVQAIICRALVQEGERYIVKVEARCFGPKRTCDTMVDAFRQN